MIQNQTRGLFGNWSTDLYDDFTLPDGTPGPSLDINNLESLHNSFGMKCKSFKKIQISILFAMIRNSNF
jgi:hypothetical protein